VIEAYLLLIRQKLCGNQKILNKVPVMTLGNEAIQNSEPRPVSPYYSDISIEVAKQFNAALKGDVPPEQVVKTLQTELTNIVKQTN
jgi:multiple sugar transport system substrate-binding protein